MGIELNSHCPICDRTRPFAALDDFDHPRETLTSHACPNVACVVRERAVAHVLFDLVAREEVRTLSIHEAAPANQGLSLWLRKNCSQLIRSGYFPQLPFGTTAAELRNEDLEAQTFANETFDVVLHTDVMEHLFNPFTALREIYRTLKPGGLCLFTAPTYPDRVKSEQVAFLENNELRVVGDPEYHGNPQDIAGGSIVTWRYGYDLPLLITRATKFEVEVRRWQSRDIAIMGLMSEVYILRKPGAEIGRPWTPLSDARRSLKGAIKRLINRA